MAWLATAGFLLTVSSALVLSRFGAADQTLPADAVPAPHPATVSRPPDD
jgi:hypothetical protein